MITHVASHVATLQLELTHDPSDLRNPHALTWWAGTKNPIVVKHRKFRKIEEALAVMDRFTVS